MHEEFGSEFAEEFMFSSGIPEEEEEEAEVASEEEEEEEEATPDVPDEEEL